MSQQGRVSGAAKRQRASEPVSQPAHSSAATGSNGQSTARDGLPLMTAEARRRVQELADLADFEVTSKDGTVFGGLHRLKLADQSRVIRGMVADLGQVPSVMLTDDASHVAMVLSQVYDPDAAIQPQNLAVLLQLADKYDMPDLIRKATQVLDTFQLTKENVLFWTGVTAQVDRPDAVNDCLDYAAANLGSILRVHKDEKFAELPAHVLVRMLMPRLRLAEETLGCIDATLTEALSLSAHPVYPASYPVSVPLLQDNPHSPYHGPLDTGVLQRMHFMLSIRAHKRMCSCLGGGGDGRLDGPNCRHMYEMLPRACPRLCPPPQQQNLLPPPN